MTNVGSAPLTVLPSTRNYASLGATEKTVAIGPTGTTIAYPTTGSALGPTARVTFAVPGGHGRARLDDPLAERRDARARPARSSGCSLFAPDGTYAANTRPQGGAAPANYGDVLVAAPRRRDVDRGALHPGHRRLHRQRRAAHQPAARPAGRHASARRRSPSRPAPAGTSRSSETVPAVGGDTVYTVALGQLRRPPGRGAGHRTRGGPDQRQGRGARSPGRSAAATPARPARRRRSRTASTCRPGKRDLDVSVTLAQDAGDLLQGVLVDPNGETPSIAVQPDDPTGAPGPVDAEHGGRPDARAAGATSSWSRTRCPARSSSRTSPVRSASTGWASARPSRAGRTGCGSARHGQFTVTVTNPGPAPIAVQADPRTTAVGAGPAGSAVRRLDDPAAAERRRPVAGSRRTWCRRTPLGCRCRRRPRCRRRSSSTRPLGGIDVFGDLQQAQGGNTISTATVRERNGVRRPGLLGHVRPGDRAVRGRRRAGRHVEPGRQRGDAGLRPLGDAPRSVTRTSPRSTRPSTPGRRSSCSRAPARRSRSPSPRPPGRRGR